MPHVAYGEGGRTARCGARRLTVAPLPCPGTPMLILAGQAAAVQPLRDLPGASRHHRPLSGLGWLGFTGQEDRPLGFAIVRSLAGPVRVLNSFFVVRSMRWAGVGLQAADSVIARHPGRSRADCRHRLSRWRRETSAQTGAAAGMAGPGHVADRHRRAARCRIDRDGRRRVDRRPSGRKPRPG